MVNVLVRWSQAREGVPFNAEEHNQIINFLQGYLAAPFTLVQVGGNAALDWNPQTDLFTFNASAILNASVTLGNTIWLEGFEADDTTKVNLIRVNGSDIIELGSSGQRISIGAALTNNTNLGGRNAANSATITLVKLNTSDVIEVGESGALLQIIAALVNNTSLAARNAANSASVTLVKLNTSDIVEVGQAGSHTNLMGTSNTMRKLDEQTLTGGTVDFTNISQAYRHLQIEMSSQNSAGATNVLMRLSSDGTTFDTGSNYDWQYLAASAGSSFSGESLGATSLLVGGHSASGNRRSPSTIKILDYTDTTREKTVLVQYSRKDGTASGNISVGSVGGYWRNNAAVQGIRLFPAANNFDNGRATLYGLPA